MTDTAQVSVFEPHHTTHTEYPCFELLAVSCASRHCLLLPVDNASERYEPRPLIDDKAVAAHASRESHAETTVFSLTKATCFLRAEEIEEATTPKKLIRGAASEEARPTLRKHMSLIIACQGETSLKAATFRRGPPECAILTQKALPAALDRFDGLHISTGVLFMGLGRELLCAFFHEFLSAGCHHSLTHEELCALSEYPTAPALGLRPGFAEFVWRSLSRTLQFCTVRKCEDKEMCFSRWHKHGEKQYYKTESVNGEVGDSHCALTKLQRWFGTQ
ncbi:hypothetical protein LTR85_003476 [Meristemomyces frigidus]|nr:hypothetical protein LTR85_003476 [Meristemomyces frigidus]